MTRIPPILRCLDHCWGFLGGSAAMTVCPHYKGPGSTLAGKLDPPHGTVRAPVATAQARCGQIVKYSLRTYRLTYHGQLTAFLYQQCSWSLTDALIGATSSPSSPWIPGLKSPRTQGTVQGQQQRCKATLSSPPCRLLRGF